MRNLINIIILLIVCSSLFSYGDRRDDGFAVGEKQEIVLKSKYWVKSNGVWDSVSQNKSIYYYDIKQMPDIVVLKINSNHYFINRNSLNFDYKAYEPALLDISFVMVTVGDNIESALYKFYTKYGKIDGVLPEKDNFRLNYYQYEDVIQYYFTDYDRASNGYVYSWSVDLLTGGSVTPEYNTLKDSYYESSFGHFLNIFKTISKSQLDD